LTDVSADADVRVICGPTAAGKSAVALWLAEREPTTIVSADSRQVYRGFDIGTAKPTPAERACVPHFGLDIAEPDTRYSAAAWAADAERWMRDVRSMGREPVIVGGTGFYIRALTTPLFVEPELDPVKRRAIAAHLRTLGLAAWVRGSSPVGPVVIGAAVAQPLTRAASERRR